jgi:hypothetical protein
LSGNLGKLVAAIGCSKANVKVLGKKKFPALRFFPATPLKHMPE